MEIVKTVILLLLWESSGGMASVIPLLSRVVRIVGSDGHDGQTVKLSPGIGTCSSSFACRS